MQRGDRGVGLEHDVAAAAAVAAVGTALGHVGFSAERHASRAAVTGLDVNLYLVDEHVECTRFPAGVRCTAVILVRTNPPPRVRTEGSRRYVCRKRRRSRPLRPRTVERARDA